MSGEPRFVGGTEPGARAPAAPVELSPEDRETQQRLIDALTAARGNVTEAARALGTGRVQLHRVMKRLGIDAERFRD